MNKNNLAAELRKYLKKHWDDPNFWSREDIGKQIKEFCENRGNFKRPRGGNPKKGYQKMLEHFDRINNPDAHIHENKNEEYQE